jgi:homoserine kinase type II
MMMVLRDGAYFVAFRTRARNRTMQQVDEIIAAYPEPFHPDHVQALGGAGGFSGARFWRLQSPAGTFCLRRWPQEHPTPTRLQTIHDVLHHVRRSGLEIVPEPIFCHWGSSYVQHSGHLWELSVWMPGCADYWQSPSPVRLRAALQALAHFHQAADSFAGDCEAFAVAPSIRERSQLLNGLLDGGLRRVSAAVGAAADSAVTAVAEEILHLFPAVAPQVLHQLAIAGRLTVPLQPCLRDIWHDHVLFTGERVSGLIDFGALRHDSIAVDLARLLGSLVGDDAAGWQSGLDAYQAVRPLSRDQSVLIAALDTSGTLLSGINWLRWLYVQRRTFEDAVQIERRIRVILGRLENLVMRSGRSVMDADRTTVAWPLIMP